MKLLFSIALLVLLTSCKITPGTDREVELDISIPDSEFLIEW
jgi:hypothetical protein